MKNKILCAEFSNPIEAKDAYRSLTSQENIRLLEFGEVNGSSLVLLAEADQFVSPQIDKDSIIDEPHPQLMPAYFKTITTEFNKNLCILQSQSLIRLIKSCDFLLKNHGYQALEIYRGKSESQPAFALLCNGENNFALPCDYKNVDCYVIEKLNDYILENFF